VLTDEGSFRNDFNADVQKVKEHLLAFFFKAMEEAEVLVPYQDPHGLIGEIRRQAAVLHEAYEEKGVRLRIRTSAEELAKLRKLLPPQ
jgi:GTP-binding protein HflX